MKSVTMTERSYDGDGSGGDGSDGGGSGGDDGSGGNGDEWWLMPLAALLIY